MSNSKPVLPASFHPEVINRAFIENAFDMGFNAPGEDNPFIPDSPVHEAFTLGQFSATLGDEPMPLGFIEEGAFIPVGSLVGRHVLMYQRDAWGPNLLPVYAKPEPTKRPGILNVGAFQRMRRELARVQKLAQATNNSHAVEDAIPLFHKIDEICERALNGTGPDECSAERLSAMLRDHVAKGDPVDVANFAMMLHQRGERIGPAKPAGAIDALKSIERAASACIASNEEVMTIAVERTMKAVFDYAVKALEDAGELPRRPVEEITPASPGAMLTHVPYNRSEELQNAVMCLIERGKVTLDAEGYLVTVGPSIADQVEAAFREGHRHGRSRIASVGEDEDWRFSKARLDLGLPPEAVVTR